MPKTRMTRRPNPCWRRIRFSRSSSRSLRRSLSCRCRSTASTAPEPASWSGPGDAGLGWPRTAGASGRSAAGEPSSPRASSAMTVALAAKAAVAVTVRMADRALRAIRLAAAKRIRATAGNLLLQRGPGLSFRAIRASRVVVGLPSQDDPLPESVPVLSARLGIARLFGLFAVRPLKRIALLALVPLRRPGPRLRPRVGIGEVAARRAASGPGR